MAMQHEESVGGPLSAIRRRIRAAADEYEETRQALELCKERRDEAIIAGRDEEQLSYPTLAIDSHLSRARVIAIVGGG